MLPYAEHADYIIAGAAADVITPDDVFDVLEEDVRDADMILWVGISFQQSASTAYFRRVRGYLQASLTSTAWLSMHLASTGRPQNGCMLDTHAEPLAGR